MSVRAAAVLVAVAAIAGVVHASNPSPCRLVTVGEVKAAFGGSVSPGKVDTAVPSAPTCHFEVKSSNLGLDGDAVVFITPGQTPQTFALAKKLVPGAVAVGGVGSSAFYNRHTTSVELLEGTTVASAQGIFLNPGGSQPDAAKVKADTVALAKAVAKHL